MKNGDIFAVPLMEDMYIFGRVILNIESAKKKRLFPADSPLPLGNSLLIEMYRDVSSMMRFEPSEILIPGAFVSREDAKEWHVVAHAPILVEEVNFPEELMMWEGTPVFHRGEIRLPLPLSRDDLSHFQCFGTIWSSFLWRYVCLDQLGRTEEIPQEYRTAYRPWDLAHHDLRYTAHRDEIYQYLPINPADTYYKQQRQLELNLDRLYA